MRQVYQDDDFIYPSLDISDEEAEVLAKQEKGKDLNWKPKARVKSLERRSSRPTRDGAKKIHLEKGLEEVSKRLSSDKTKKKKKVPKMKLSSSSCKTSSMKNSDSSSSSSTPAAAAAAATTVTINRSKMATAPKIPKVAENKITKPKSKTTAKQRLGKLLKLKF